MLRFIRDLLFPRAYDLGNRSRAGRSAASAAAAQREKPQPASGAGREGAPDVPET